MQAVYLSWILYPCHPRTGYSHAATNTLGCTQAKGVSREPNSADRIPLRCAILSLLAAGFQSAAVLPLRGPTSSPEYDTSASAHVSDTKLATQSTAAAVTSSSRLPTAVNTILRASQHESAAVRWEALAAMRVLCQHRFMCVLDCWQHIMLVVRAHLTPEATIVADAAPPSTPASKTVSRGGGASTAATATMSEKAANQALRLAGVLAEYTTAVHFDNSHLG